MKYGDEVNGEDALIIDKVPSCIWYSFDIGSKFYWAF
jgi:hypothetical protein